MEAQKPLEQETPETTPQEAPTATIPQPESTPAANMEADPIPEEMDASPESPAKKTAGKLAALIGGGIVAVLGIFYLVLCIVSASHGTILGRTDVMGVDMSGLTVPQAQERWQQKGQAVCQATQLPLTLDGETAGQVSLWELGVSVTPETAAQLAYKAAMPEANPVLLEPVGELKVTVPDSYMGDVIGDLNKRRGRVMGMTPTADGEQIIEAEVPMAEMTSYAIDLRAMTQSRGSFVFHFVRYEDCPPAAQAKAIEAAKAMAEE